MSKLPKDYHVWAEGADVITVVMTDFMMIFREAEEFIEYKGHTWKRGMLLPIPHGSAGTVCSAREYKRVKKNHEDYKR